MQWVGLIGSGLLSIAGIPEVLRTIRDKRCHLGLPFLIIWAGGEVLTLIYVIPMGDIPLLLNYVFNFFVVGIMLGYKILNIKTTGNETIHKGKVIKRGTEWPD
jgi:uncharacterized protein with PQ loop repeat